MPGRPHEVAYAYGTWTGLTLVFSDRCWTAGSESPAQGPGRVHQVLALLRR